MYTRRDVCKLANIDEARFKALAYRDQLPTVPASAGVRERDEDQAPGWSRFSAYELIQIAVAERLSCQLGYVKGLRPDDVAKIASECGEGLMEMLSRTSGPDIWVGYVGRPAERGGFVGGENVYGTITQVAKKIGDVSMGIAERAFLVNASEIYRTVAERSEELGILFPNDESVSMMTADIEATRARMRMRQRTIASR
jgi:hypothetical protein